jgi:hypothetical protein
VWEEWIDWGGSQGNFLGGCPCSRTWSGVGYLGVSIHQNLLPINSAPLQNKSVDTNTELGNTILGKWEWEWIKNSEAERAKRQIQGGVLYIGKLTITLWQTDCWFHRIVFGKSYMKSPLSLNSTRGEKNQSSCVISLRSLEESPTKEPSVIKWGRGHGSLAVQP